ncbi:MAG: DMT family transporter, partial [Stackebrandtia sp.]
MWQVALAVLGAWCIAIGAAAQEQPATAAPGREVARAAAVLGLFRDPRWLAGGVLTIVGVTAHLIALSAAPVTVVQPLGVSGLLVAVWLAARWRGRFLSRLELAGAGAVTLGLAGLVWTLPHGSTEVPALPAPLLAGLAGFAVVSGFAVPPVARRIAGRWRVLLLATTAGMCFGLGSALARVVASRVAGDPSVLWSPTTFVAVALLAVGGLHIQNAYRTGHFGLAYATLLIADPLVAAAIGVGVLGEGLPASVPAMAGCLLSAVTTTAGVIVLAGQTKPPRHPVPPAEPPTTSPTQTDGSSPARTDLPLPTQTDGSSPAETDANDITSSDRDDAAAAARSCVSPAKTKHSAPSPTQCNGRPSSDAPPSTMAADPVRPGQNAGTASAESEVASSAERGGSSSSAEAGSVPGHGAAAGPGGRDGVRPAADRDATTPPLQFAWDASPSSGAKESAADRAPSDGESQLFDATISDPADRSSAVAASNRGITNHKENNENVYFDAVRSRP